MSELSEEKIKQIREKLETRRAELVDKSRTAQQEMKNTDPHSPADSVDESTEEQGVSTRLKFADRNKDSLADVNEAIERIDQGDFGNCLECEEPIPPKRLEAMPTAKLCIDCKERLEKKEKSQKRKPGMMDDMPY
jgi:DnaK suppressor protein